MARCTQVPIVVYLWVYSWVVIKPRSKSYLGWVWGLAPLCVGTQSYMYVLCCLFICTKSTQKTTKEASKTMLKQDYLKAEYRPESKSKGIANGIKEIISEQWTHL